MFFLYFCATMNHLFLETLWYYVHGFIFTYQNLLITIVIGAISGLVAQMILPGRGFGMFATLIIGILSCVVGNKYLKHYHHYLTSIRFLNYVICATVCSIIVMFVINIIRGGEDKDKTHWRHN